MKTELKHQNFLYRLFELLLSFVILFQYIYYRIFHLILYQCYFFLAAIIKTQMKVH